MAELFIYRCRPSLASHGRSLTQNEFAGGGTSGRVTSPLSVLYGAGLVFEIIYLLAFCQRNMLFVLTAGQINQSTGRKGLKSTTPPSFT